MNECTAYPLIRQGNFTVGPSAGGNGDVLTVSIPSGSAYDRANNANAVSNAISITYDAYFGLPTVSLHSTDAGRFGWTNASPYYVYATFHEPVFGFDIDDVSASGGTINVVEQQECVQSPLP